MGETAGPVGFVFVGTQGEKITLNAKLDLKLERVVDVPRETVFRADEGARQRHEDIGFNYGWDAALDQLVASVKALG